MYVALAIGLHSTRPKGLSFSRWISGFEAFLRSVNDLQAVVPCWSFIFM